VSSLPESWPGQLPEPGVLIVTLSAAVISGAWAAGILPVSAPLVFLLTAGAGTVFAGMYFWRPAAAACFLWLFFFFLAMLRFVQAETMEPGPGNIGWFIGHSVTVKGEVDALPRVFPADDENIYVRYVLSVREYAVGPGEHFRPASGRLIVNVKEKAGQPVAPFGAVLTASGQLTRPHGFNNPGQIDLEAMLRRQGIVAKLNTAGEKVRVEHSDSEHSWEAGLANWRDRATKKMLYAMPPEDAAIINGILFGGYDGIRHDVAKNFATTGIVHILSVSGAHVALVAGVVLWTAGRLGIRQVWAAAFAGAAIILYGLLSGFTPPVVRSALMGLMGLAALGMGRFRDSPAALSVAIISMVLYKPSWIFDISFQLSVAATAGIIFLYPRLLSWLRGVPRWLAGNLAVTAAAQLAALPFLAWYFSSLSISAFIANLVIVPIIEAVMVIGIVALGVGSLWGFAGHLLLVISGLLVGVAVEGAAFLARLPGGQINFPAMPISMSLAYYAICYGYSGTSQNFCRACRK